MGDLYIAEVDLGRVLKLSNGTITTVEGGGAFPGLGDGGPAIGAQIYFLAGIALDSAGNLYIADVGNNRIRKVSNGVITTFAGGGSGLGIGDSGPALNAQLNSPGGLAADSTGNLYIADTDNLRVREVSNGVIATVAGDGTPGSLVITVRPSARS